MKKKPTGGIIQLMPTIDSKTKLNEMASQLAQSVIDGHADPLEAATALDAMAKIIAEAIDKIDPSVMDALGKYHKGEKITIGRVEIQRRESAPKYDYTGCGDTVHTKLLAEKKEAETALKEREQFLKALPKPITAVDEETGEIIRIHPPAKTSVSTYAILYPKD